VCIYLDVMDSASFTTLVLVLLGSAQGARGSELVRRQTSATRYCNAQFGNVCYAQYLAPNNIVYRVAIPDTAAAPFDVLVQITAPVSLGWAGLAWGGTMANNPLTVAWVNGNEVAISSRWTT